jgi:nitronate monooxygenase
MAQSSAMVTKLLQRYPWVSLPFIVSAPMSGHAGPELAVAVSRAGGLGFIGPGAETKDMNRNMEEAISLLKDTQLYGRVEHGLSPVGVAFLMISIQLYPSSKSITRAQPGFMPLNRSSTFTNGQAVYEARRRRRRFGPR